jgi:putative ATPase
MAGTRTGTGTRSTTGEEAGREPSLFAHHADKSRVGQPLAERMRPRELGEVVGQPQLLGAGKLLARLAQPGAFLPSLILWGPPGTGKTTIGRLLAQQAGARFAPLSAVLSGVKELRQELDEARAQLVERGRKTVLFIDEIHRYSKSQQDALLPHVEAGTVILIGATTENPSFALTGALLSRCRVLALQPLEQQALLALIDRALTDKERGLGNMRVEMPAPVRELLADAASGDARRALSTLEAAVHLAPPDEQGVRKVDAETLTQALQARVLRYDKDGDQHYDVISAFIKSMRGSDPDAAVYYLARLLSSGEDPLFVLRRMVIFAAEDVGVADPRALPLAMATVEAFRFVGMPEGVLPLTELALFLATAPKTNTAVTAYAAAREALERTGDAVVPAHLRDGHSAASRATGSGIGYKYPHDFPGHYVSQRYLPEGLPEGAFYQPSQSGYEKTIGERMAYLRNLGRQGSPGGPGEEGK